MGEKKTNQKKEFIEQTANTSITGLVKDKPKKVFLFFSFGTASGSFISSVRRNHSIRKKSRM
ncbi:MAG: hypothetical protein ACQERH_06250 [Acidobacteriota bacterium]